MLGHQNNYKQKYADFGMWKEGKKGQVTIFIIVAIVIVLVVLAVFLYPRISITGAQEFSPNNYLKSCMEPGVKESAVLLGKNAGYSNPEGFIVNNGEKIKYLCYTNKYYEQCVVQQPMIRENFEKELQGMINSKAQGCIKSLKAEYESRGYGVSAGGAESSVSIVPGKIKINIRAPITITKEESKTFREFDIDYESNMYDLIMIAMSIVDYETTYGDSETTVYMQYYPDLKIEKETLSDGSRIYRITNVITDERFVFATRSVAWPPGYAGE